jgi:hypothetical protein
LTTARRTQGAANDASGVGATCVGIGGVKTRGLIQAGTQDSGSGRKNQYQQWIEMLPAASKQVPLMLAEAVISVVIARSVNVFRCRASRGQSDEAARMRSSASCKQR